MTLIQLLQFLKMKYRVLSDFKIGTAYEEFEFELSYVRTELNNKLEYDVYLFNGLISDIENKKIEIYFNGDILSRVTLIATIT